MITRRNFCAGLALAIAAPYVVRNSGVLMPVRERSIYATYLISGYNGDNKYVSEKIRVRDPLFDGDGRKLVTSRTEWRTINSIRLLRVG